MTKRSSPLIEKKSDTKLDCMGEVVKAIDFCQQKEIFNEFLTRGLVTEKSVKCQSGKRVILKWSCEGESDRFCRDKDIGCFYFKELLARRLSLVHHSLNDGVLNCYFDTEVNTITLNNE